MSLSPAEQMERSRSNSESVVNASSRAAKRMGFVVRKNQDLSSVAESSGSHHSLTTTASSMAPITATTRAPPPQLPPSLANGIPPNIGSRFNCGSASNVTGMTGHAKLRRGHTRGVSHDSVMEVSYSGQSVPSSDPLSTTSSSSSTSSTTSNSNRDRVNRVNRQLSAGAAGSGSANSGTGEIEPQPNAYFRRLSVLQEQMSPAVLLQFSSAAFSNQVVESARGILFTLSQVLPAMRQFLAFCDDRTLSGTLSGIIYNTRLHIDTLIRTLEHHDALLTSPSLPGSNRRVPQQAQSVASAAIEPIIHAALACIGAFRHIISIVHANVKTLAGRAEIRHTRAFFLLSYGALAEVRNAWTALAPALAECRVPVSTYLSREIFSSKTASRSGSKSPSLPPHPPVSELMPPPALPPLATPNLWPQGPKSSGIMTNISSSIGTMSSPISAIPPTPGLTLPLGLFSPLTATTSAPTAENGPYAFHFSIEPSETDEGLFERIEVATQSAMNVLKLVLDGMAKVVDNDDTKMRELANMCDYGLDVTGRLRERLGNIRGADATERTKFGEDTNAFVKGIISVLEFTKTILNDYQFLNDARPQLSSLTRVTKEVLTVTLKPTEKAPEKAPG
ncbi:RAM signaling pathway protein-domain-containing protein [Lipomyces kononenkoae]